MKKNKLIGLGALLAVPMMAMSVLPANATHSNILPPMKCGWGLSEIHVTSTARHSVTHSTYDNVMGNNRIFAGSSPAYFFADTHHWLRRDIYGGSVTTSGTIVDIQSSASLCK